MIPKFILDTYLQKFRRDCKAHSVGAITVCQDRYTPEENHARTRHLRARLIRAGYEVTQFLCDREDGAGEEVVFLAVDRRTDGSRDLEAHLIELAGYYGLQSVFSVRPDSGGLVISVGEGGVSVQVDLDELGIGLFSAIRGESVSYGSVRSIEPVEPPGSVGARRGVWWVTERELV